MVRREIYLLKSNLDRIQEIAEILAVDIDKVFNMSLLRGFGKYLHKILAYGTAQIHHSFQELDKVNAYLKYQRLYNEYYDGEETLAEANGEAAIGAQAAYATYAIHASAIAQTDHHDYIGNVIFAPENQLKSYSGTKYVPLEMDHSLQAKNLFGYSDHDKGLLSEFFNEVPRSDAPEVNHTQNSILIVEDLIYDATSSDEDEEALDTIILTMFYGVPILDFVSSNNKNKRIIPEFYEEYPLCLSRET